MLRMRPKIKRGTNTRRVKTHSLYAARAQFRTATRAPITVAIAITASIIRRAIPVMGCLDGRALPL